MCRDQEGCAVVAYCLGVLSAMMRNALCAVGVVVMLGRGKVQAAYQAQTPGERLGAQSTPR